MGTFSFSGRHVPARMLAGMETEMPDVPVEKRSGPRYPLVLSAEVIELPRGAKLTARTSDMCRTGCYLDTLNPIPKGSKVRIRVTHHQEIFEAVGCVVYASPSMGMGVTFEDVAAEQQARLDRWLNSSGEEY
jgi:PilZ domain-containing protein